MSGGGSSKQKANRNHLDALFESANAGAGEANNCGRNYLALGYLNNSNGGGW